MNHDFIQWCKDMTAKAKRLFVIVGVASLLGIAAMLVLEALRDNIVFFYTPSEINQSDRTSMRQLRLGGLVKGGTVKIEGMQSVFTVTDGNADITVRYNNALPSLFREGQGVVAEGQIQNGIFIAHNVLAKHDENYMPAEVADKLKQQGVWQGSDSN